MKLPGYKQVSVALLSVSLLLLSCDKDEDKKLSADQAEQSFVAADADVAASLEELSNSPGFTAIEDLSGLTDDEAPLPFRTKNDKKNPRVLIHKAIFGLKQIATAPAKNGRIKGDEAFEFADHVGVYVWNAETETFDEAGTSTIIEIQFPTEGSATNDAKFQLTAYEEDFTPDGDEQYSPTVIEATLAIDNAQVASLSLDVEYVGDGSSEPLVADITYNVGDFSVDVDYDNSASTQVSFSETLRKDDSIIVGWGINAVFNTPDKLEEDIQSLTGFFQLVNVRFDIVITQPDANSTDFDDFITITISVDNNAAATVVWITDSVTGEPVPYIQYNDGSQQPLEEVFSAFGEVLDDLDVIG